MFECPSHQVEASSDQDVDLGCVAQCGRLGHHAGFQGHGVFGRVRQRRVPSLRDPLEGAEDAGKHRRGRFLLGDQRQAVLD